MTTPTSPHSTGFTVDLGFALVALGAITATLSTFLPWEESPSYRAIEQNTLIQQGGWILIGLAFGAAVVAFRVGSGHSDSWWAPLILVALCAGFLLIQANSSHTLYPVKPDGEVDTSGPGVKASLGIAIYVAWLGVALMGIGTRVGRSNVRSRQGAPKPKAADTPTPTGKAANVKCFNCQHIQQVPVSATSFVCEKCSAKLTRTKKS
jgi:ribosomal protein S27E